MIGTNEPLGLQPDIQGSRRGTKTPQSVGDVFIVTRISITHYGEAPMPQFVQISDSEVLEEIVADVIASNTKSVEDYMNGKERAAGYLVGQVMKATKGKANPNLVNEILHKQLKDVSEKK